MWELGVVTTFGKCELCRGFLRVPDSLISDFGMPDLEFGALSESSLSCLVGALGHLGSAARKLVHCSSVARISTSYSPEVDWTSLNYRFDSYLADIRWKLIQTAAMENEQLNHLDSDMAALRFCSSWAPFLAERAFYLLEIAPDWNFLIGSVCLSSCLSATFGIMMLAVDSDSVVDCFLSCRYKHRGLDTGRYSMCFPLTTEI